LVSSVIALSQNGIHLGQFAPPDGRGAGAGFFLAHAVDPPTFGAVGADFGGMPQAILAKRDPRHADGHDDGSDEQPDQ